MTIERLQDAEARAVEELEPTLHFHLALSADAFTLIADLIAASPQGLRMKDLPPSLHVATKLLLRLSNELRGIELLTVRGYPMQACNIAASAYEVAFTIGYIGDDDARAQVWGDHNNPTRFPWDIPTMTRETLRALGCPDLETETAAAYRVYRQCCMAKHGNPILEGRFGVQVGDGNVVIINGPDTSEDAIRPARYALEHAVGVAIIAMRSFLLLHLPKYVPLATLARFAGQVETLYARRMKLGDASNALYGTADPFRGRW